MRTSAWIKSLVGGGVIIIGGPMLLNYLQPSEEELFKRYNPDLQRRSLEARDQKLQDANDFVNKLKEMSKDKRPIWTVWKEQELMEKKEKRRQEQARLQEQKTIADEIRKQRMEGEE